MIEELLEFDSLFDSVFDDLSSSFDQVLNECNLLIDKEFKGLSDRQTKTTRKQRPLSSTDHALRTTFSACDSFDDNSVLCNDNVHSTPPSSCRYSVPLSCLPKKLSSNSTSSLLPRLIARAAAESETVTKPPSTVPCALCGRKFLPERLVSFSLTHFIVFIFN